MKRAFVVCVVFAALVGVFWTPTRADAQQEMKNMIMMISDGWGINHVNATNYWHGENRQDYQSFPIRLYMSTYSQNGIEGAAPNPAYDPAVAWTDFYYMLLRATDSASSATAMSTGVKTYNGRINIGPDGNQLFTVTERAKELGKSVGVVTSVMWSHATPAGYIAHNISRNNYVEIAQEMIAGDADVIMGCGHPYFNNNHEPITPSSPNDWKYVGGEVQWNDLVDGNTDWTLIQSRLEFQSLMTDPNPPARVCGTAQCRSTLQQKRTTVLGEVPNGTAPPYSAPLNDVPTLEEMTRGALNVVDDNPLGFLLMIEGGAVDWAGHANQMGRMIEEQTDFNNAVDAVISWVEANSNWNETLLIVTGDHETGYLWGPGSGEPATFNEIVDNGAGNLPSGWYYSGGHSNSLIPIYTKGIGSAWFNVYADEMDPVRGAYIDNIEIADVIFGYYDEILPVELIAFDAIVGDGNVKVNWTTASEENNDHFEIVRDGIVVAEVTATNSASASAYEWIDSDVKNGSTYTYRLYSVDMSGVREALAEQTVTMNAMSRALVSEYALHPNYPNPFNPKTAIRYDVMETGQVTVKIYDLMGREIAKLVHGTIPAGSHSVTWDATGLPSGVYLCRMKTINFIETRKLLLVK